MRKAVLGALAKLLRHGLGPSARAELIDEAIGAQVHVQHMTDHRRLQYQKALALNGSCDTLISMGANGLFLGNVKDECVFDRYVLERQWAPALVAFIRAQFPSRLGTYIDVGANIGLTTIPVAKACGVRCIAIEAEPRNFQYLCSNARINGVNDLVEAKNFAAYSDNTTLRIELSNHNFGDHHLLPDTAAQAAQGQQNTVLIDARRLDDVLNSDGLERPIVCKIDTQGAEPDVILGARNLMRESRIVVIEADPLLLARMGHSLEELLGLLRDQGFEQGAVAMFDDSEQSGNLVLKPATDALEEVKLLLERGEKRYVDLVLTRENGSPRR